MPSTAPDAYAGQPLPFGQLSPSAFEEFVCGALNAAGPNHGFREVRLSSGPTDGGFDAFGIRIKDGGKICIQCKRYQEALSVDIVAKEIAKVALQSKLEGSTIAEHLIITSGKRQKKLESALRQEGRKTIEDAALAEAADKEGELHSLVEKSENNNIDIDSCIRLYVKLTTLSVWDSRDLDVACGAVHSKLADLIECYFAVSVQLREKPRPDFDENKYLAHAAEEFVVRIPLRGHSSSSPETVRVESAALAGLGSINTSGAEISDVVLAETIATISPGESALVCGAGGAGKTTTMKMAWTLAAERRRAEADTPLPIFVSLDRYNGDINALIDNSVGITNGVWQSIPGPILLLCDGLNEIPPDLIKNFYIELASIVELWHVTYVVSVRPAALRRTVVLSVKHVWTLDALRWREMASFIAASVPSDNVAIVLEWARGRLGSRDWRLVTLPFALATAISLFMKTGRLPDTTAELIQLVIGGRIQRNEELVELLPQEVREVPRELVVALAEQMSFELRVLRQLSSVSTQDSQEIVSLALKRVRASAAFGADSLTDMLAKAVLVHYDFLTTQDEKWTTFSHDIVSDFLAAPVLARQWRQYVASLRRSRRSDDAWIFAAALIRGTDRLDYLRAIAAIDLELAAAACAPLDDASLKVIENLAITRMETERVVDSAVGASALAILGSPRAQTYLRERLGEINLNDYTPQHYHVLRALLRLGETDIAEAILDDADKFAAPPFSVSGGSVSLWDAAPAGVALDIARKRLKEQCAASRDPVATWISMQTIARLGDESDIDSIRYVMERTSKLYLLNRSLHVLYSISAQQAVATLKSRLRPDNPPGINVHINKYLFDVGATVEFGPLLAFIEAGGSAEDPLALGTAEEILKSMQLDESQRKEIQNAFDRSADARGSLWRIATGQKISAFDDLAFAALGDVATFGFACMFAADQNWPEERERKFLVALVEKLESSSVYMEAKWNMFDAVSFLIRVGELQRAADTVSGVIYRIIQFESERESPAHFETRLAIEIGLFIPQLGQLASLLPQTMVWSLLMIDYSMAGDDNHESLRAILSRLSPDELDSYIDVAPESLALAALLKITAPWGPTEVRYRVLASLLHRKLLWLPLVSVLAKIIEAWWSDGVLRAVVDAFVVQEWDGYDASICESLIRTVDGKITESQANQFVVPVLASAELSPQSRGVLQVWLDLTKLRRPGDDADEGDD